MPEPLTTCEHPFCDWYVPAVSEMAVRRMLLRPKPSLPSYDRHKAQLERMTKQWLEARRRKLRDISQNARPVLQDLASMLEEENEPDFMHRPTDYAYEIARQIIENAYTHYLGSAPAPAIAPDGEGGVIVEWKTGQRIVRLVVSPSQDKRSYVYSKGVNRSQVDYSASGFTLAQQLRAIFAE